MQLVGDKKREKKQMLRKQISNSFVREVDSTPTRNHLSSMGILVWIGIYSGPKREGGGLDSYPRAFLVD